MKINKKTTEQIIRDIICLSERIQSNTKENKTIDNLETLINMQNFLAKKYEKDNKKERLTIKISEKSSELIKKNNLVQMKFVNELINSIDVDKINKTKINKNKLTKQVHITSAHTSLEILRSACKEKKINTNQFIDSLIKQKLK